MSMGEFVELAKRHGCHGHGHMSVHSQGASYMNDMMGTRISSVFVILIASGLGGFFPILASRYSFIRMPKWVFFFCKYFGSGVIIATAFIHLLFHASLNLSGDCLGEKWAEFPYALAIMLGTLFLVFFLELMAFKYVENKLATSTAKGHVHSHFGDESAYVRKDSGSDEDDSQVDSRNPVNNTPSHFAHSTAHHDKEALEIPMSDIPMSDKDKEQYFGQLLSVCVLEFGVLFHSAFVGLTLGVATEEFNILYIVIVFHQFFEGLGLGSRIATTIWPKDKRWTPWLFAVGFTVITPIGIAVGLGVRQTYKPSSPQALITSGVLDAISAGILVYTGLVELMAHEFLFSDEFKGNRGLNRMLWAYFLMCLGCGLMSFLGKWA